MVIKGGETRIWSEDRSIRGSGKIRVLHNTINPEQLHSVLGCYSKSTDFY